MHRRVRTSTRCGVLIAVSSICTREGPVAESRAGADARIGERAGRSCEPARSRSQGSSREEYGDLLRPYPDPCRPNRYAALSANAVRVVSGPEQTSCPRRSSGTRLRSARGSGGRATGRWSTPCVPDEAPSPLIGSVESVTVENDRLRRDGGVGHRRDCRTKARQDLLHSKTFRHVVTVALRGRPGILSDFRSSLQRRRERLRGR